MVIYFYSRGAAYLRDAVSKVRLSERKAKGKRVFLFFAERKYLRQEPLTDSITNNP